MEKQKIVFYKKLNEYYTTTKKDSKKPWNYAEMKEVVNDILIAKQKQGKKTRRQYHLASLYDIVEEQSKQVVIKKRAEENGNIIYVTPYEDMFDVLHSTHIRVGHGSRDKIMQRLKSKYQIPRPAIERFLESCEICQKRKNRKLANLVNKLVISKDLSARGQVDLLDYQSYQDGEYKWLLNYQDHRTKFICLRPLKSKTETVVASELLKIMLQFGAPAILQSGNRGKFISSVILELLKFWPELKIYGRPRHSQLHASIKKSNQDIKNMIRTWMEDNNSTNWSLGCYFVQYQKNCSYHGVIDRTPYKALFGIDPEIGLSTNLPHELLQITIKTEYGSNDVELTENGETTCNEKLSTE